MIHLVPLGLDILEDSAIAHDRLHELEQAGARPTGGLHLIH